jgi:hypothetical protein
MKRLYFFATLIELFGISLTSAGLAYEVATGADLGYQLMTLGSIFVAGGSLLFAKVAPWMRGKK